MVLRALPRLPAAALAALALGLAVRRRR
jgi:hypothetical protein